MSSLDDRQVQALAFLASTTRPRGATRWDAPGLVAFIRKLLDRGLSAQEIVDRTMRHAWDPHAKTPGVLLSPAHTEPDKGNPVIYPARRGEDCKLHAGERREHCRACAADRLVGDTTSPPNLHRDVDLAPVVAELKGHTTTQRAVPPPPREGSNR